MTRALACVAVAVALAACGDGDEGEAEPLVEDEVPDDAASDDAASDVEVAERRAEHAVFRLGDNRPLAHVERGAALWIDAEGPGFVKYLRFGRPERRWELGQSVADEAVAMAGKLSAIEVPLTEDQAAAADAVSMRVYVSKAGRVTVKVNGRKASGEASAAVAPGWQTITVPVAGDRFTAGENVVAFESGSALAVDWIQIGGEPDDEAPATYDADDDAWIVREGAALVYYVVVPEDAHLVAEVAGACRVEVMAKARKAHVGGVLEQGLGGVDLSSLVGEPVRLELTVTRCDEARLRGAALTVPGESPQRRPGEAKNVVLWIADSFGRDPEAPHLQQLGRDGAVFAQHWVDHVDPAIAVASMWTGLEPERHGLGGPGSGGDFALSPDAPRLAAALDAAGMTTLGVGSASWARRLRPDDFDDFAALAPAGSSEEVAAKMVDLGAGRLEKNKDERFFWLLAGPYDDDAFGRLVELLSTWEVAADTLVVVTGDRGRPGAPKRTDARLRVPLVLRHPGLIPMGARVTGGSDGVDLFATLVDAAGGEIPKGIDGTSLVPLAQGVGAHYPAPTVATADELTLLRLDEYKIEVDARGGVRLFDVAADPAETKNLAGTRPIARRVVADPLALYLFYQPWSVRARGQPSNLAPSAATGLAGPGE